METRQQLGFYKVLVLMALQTFKIFLNEITGTMTMEWSSCTAVQNV
jgi:hypothetical protein